MIRSFIPNFLLQAVATHANGPAASAAIRSLITSTKQRTQRRLMLVPHAGQPVSPKGYFVNRLVYTANGQEVEPGTLVRKEDQPPVADSIANIAYDNAGMVYDFYRSAFGRDSIDGRGMPIIRAGVGIKTTNGASVPVPQPPAPQPTPLPPVQSGPSLQEVLTAIDVTSHAAENAFAAQGVYGRIAAQGVVAANPYIDAAVKQVFGLHQRFRDADFKIPG